MSFYTSVCVCACVCVCVRACLRARARVRARACGDLLVVVIILTNSYLPTEHSEC